jgi:hypothetical protein
VKAIPVKHENGSGGILLVASSMHHTLRQLRGIRSEKQLTAYILAHQKGNGAIAKRTHSIKDY